MAKSGSRSRLEIWARSRSRRLRSRLHHWSSQRHIEYILYLNRTNAFSHLVSTKPVARFYGLRRKTHI